MRGKLVLQAGFLTVASQVAMLLAALPGTFLLPPSLPIQLGLTLPLLVGLIVLVLPQITERLFGAQGDVPLVRTWFGATLFAACVGVGVAFAFAVINGILTVTEAQIIALIMLFFLNMSIARQWLGVESD